MGVFSYKPRMEQLCRVQLFTTARAVQLGVSRIYINYEFQPFDERPSLYS